ncbi:MAG: hypothetical protein KDI46_08980 [Alphaproteobacteria bacterium]|nr:hypothetical protein [Alphaproteobacteria bacterium]
MGMMQSIFFSRSERAQNHRDPFNPVDHTIALLQPIVARRGSTAIDTAFADFKAALETECPANRYIHAAFDPQNSTPGLSVEGIKIFGDSLLFAVTCAPQRISNCVAALLGAGYNEAASIIGHNLADEITTRGTQQPSHLDLLRLSLKIFQTGFNKLPSVWLPNVIGQGAELAFLDRDSYDYAEALYFLMRADRIDCSRYLSEENLPDIGAFEEICQEHLPGHRVYLPVRNAKAAYNANLSKSYEAFSHALESLAILPRNVGELSYRHSPHYQDQISPYNRAAAELLLNMAFESTAPSLIEAYDHMVRAYDGCFSKNEMKTLLTWSQAHLDGTEDMHVVEGAEAAQNVLAVQDTGSLVAGLDYARDLLNVRTDIKASMVACMGKVSNPHALIAPVDADQTGHRRNIFAIDLYRL